MTETSEEKVEGKKENEEPQMNYQTDSNQPKQLETIAEDEAVPQEDEEKAPEAIAANQSEVENVEEKIAEKVEANASE